MWAKHDPRLFCFVLSLLFVYGGALLIFRFSYGQFEDTTLFWPSVGIGSRHRLFRAFRILVVRARHRFCNPGDSVATMLDAISPWI